MKLENILVKLQLNKNGSIYYRDINVRDWYIQYGESVEPVFKDEDLEKEYQELLEDDFVSKVLINFYIKTMDKASYIKDVNERADAK